MSGSALMSGSLRMLDARIGVGVQEATPLGHDGILFFLLPSNLVKAINGATGDLS